MKKRWNILLLMVITSMIMGCTEDSEDSMSPYTYSDESTIMYGNSSTQFKEILFYISPYIKDGDVKKYIAIDTLLNITMKVNRLTWGKIASLPIDTTIFNLETKGNFRVTTTPIDYPVVASYQVSTANTTNAGHFADLLLNYQTLDAGDYLFRIESFEIKKRDGTAQRFPTAASVPLTVKEGQRGAYIGIFEIEVKL